jgi:hypothetical protein
MYVLASCLSVCCTRRKSRVTGMRGGLSVDVGDRAELVAMTRRSVDAWTLCRGGVGEELQRGAP